MVKRERDATLRDKDAEIACLRRLAYGVDVMDVEAGVMHIVEDAGAGAAPPLKRMRQEQAASALQERLVAVKKEHGAPLRAAGLCGRKGSYIGVEPELDDTVGGPQAQRWQLLAWESALQRAMQHSFTLPCLYF
jgi:hypothetical protein